MNAISAPLISANELKCRHAGLQNRYCLDSTPILERQSRRKSNARSYPRQIPLVLTRAQGSTSRPLGGRYS